MDNNENHIENKEENLTNLDDELFIEEISENINATLQMDQ